MSAHAMEPVPEVRRAILDKMLQAHQVKGFEHAVNAQLAEVLGDNKTREIHARDSGRHYAAARKLKAMLDALPAPEPLPEPAAGPEQA